MERIANIWWVFWLVVAFAFLLISGFGMVLMPDAQPSPGAYPARFMIFAMLAMVVCLPGWALSLWFLTRR